MSILTFSHWVHDSAVGAAIRDSLWLFPVIEGVHLLALALLGGTVLIVDLRLLDIGLRSQSTASVAQATRSWMVGGVVVMLGSGAFLYVAQATRYYGSLPFRVKMLALAAALIFSFVVKPRVVASPASAWGVRRATAVTSVLLWTVVGIAGRGIGFW